MRRRSLAALALGCAVSVLAATGMAQAAPTPPLSHAGRWITDASGRVVVVHGINMVYKLPPYYPAKAGFGDDDAAFLARIGFNAVRVGVIWKALEPSPGLFSSAYVSHIATTARTLARHGVLSLLDFHQDMYNERFQGEGAPDWAVQDGGLPNLPKAGFPTTTWRIRPCSTRSISSGQTRRDRAASGSRIASRAPGHASRRRSSGRRRCSATRSSMSRGRGPRGNRALSPTGCPAFDVKLKAFYARVFAQVRRADHRTLVWYEPNVLFNGGANTHLAPLGDARAGFAFHDYCLTESNAGPWRHARRRTTRSSHMRWRGRRAPATR